MKKLQMIYATPAAVTLLSILAASACATQDDPSSSGEETLAAPSAAAAESPTAGLRAAYIAAVQANAPEDYRVERLAASRFIAANTEQRFSSSFTEAGVEVVPDEEPEGARFVMALAAYGCEGDVAGVQKASPRASDNRVEYRRGDFVEWYVNGPLGLEQGFTLDAAPACRSRGGGEVAIEMELGGELSPVLTDDGLSLTDESGRGVLRYADLFVKDAEDKALPARFSLSGRRLSILVDDAGAVYPITVDPLVGVLKQTLLASDGKAGALFGNLVVVSGTTALVGASGANAAYVFVRNANNVWSQQKKLVSSDGLTGGFGSAVALEGDRALVGARTTSNAQGAVFVFQRTNGAWSEVQKIVPPAGGGGYFGTSAGLSGNTAIIGASLANKAHVYVYFAASGQWALQQTLVGADTAANDAFGQAVALYGDYAAVGAPYNDDNGADSGSAYIFVRPGGGTTWAQQKKFIANDAMAGDNFGTEVSLWGTFAAITSKLAGTYVFARDAATSSWSKEKTIPAFCTAFVDGTLGCKDGSTDVLLFTRSGGAWPQVGTYSAPVPVQHVALDGSGQLGVQALVGSKDASAQGVDSGAVYAVTFLRGNGDACAAAAECASGFCVDGVCCNAACGGGNDADCQACTIAKGATVNGACAPVAAGTQCRAAAGACDQAEVCDGFSNACPADSKVAAGTVCRAAAGVCDQAEACDGFANACPADSKIAAGTVCRAAAGVCDQAEVCNGSTDACSADNKLPAGTVCRASAGACDVPEVCDGATVDCSVDMSAANGDVCEGGLCRQGVCIQHCLTP